MQNLSPSTTTMDRIGLAYPLIPYFRELWRRRAFAAEMSRATMRGDNTSTFFGQAWLIIKQLLLAVAYHILVTIIRRENDPAFFAHLTLGIFAFQTGGHLGHEWRHLGDQLWEVAAKHALSPATHPLAAARTAFFRFLPTVPVYIVFHAIFLPTCGRSRCCYPCTFWQP